jgi:hypothetical protein
MEDQTKTKTNIMKGKQSETLKQILHLLDDPQTQQKIVTPGEDRLGQIWGESPSTGTQRSPPGHLHRAADPKRLHNHPWS